MKKLLIGLILVISLFLATADVSIDNWHWDQSTESIIINVTTDEPWVVYRSYDNPNNLIQIASMKKHQYKFVDHKSTGGHRYVYYSVRSIIKSGNPHKPKLMWKFDFMWKREYVPE